MRQGFCSGRGFFFKCVVMLLIFISQAVIAAEPDKTPEDIQKKAVVRKYPSATLFKQASGDAGSEALFMQIYFVMKPEMNGRVPVSKSPGKTGEPDGWLAKDSFTEWNTVQMIQLEPQSGRKLAKVFDTQNCAVSFGKNGEAPGCEEIGAEPSVWKDKRNENQKLLIPIFAKESDVFQGGFIRVYEEGSTVKTEAPRESSSRSTGSGQKSLGYDIVFVVDSTGSMGEYFGPTTAAIQEFIREKSGELSGKGQIKTPLRMGVLFYRDRLDKQDKEDPGCAESYLTRWGKEVTDDAESVCQALNTEISNCGGDGPEAVFDALNRALIDTKWQNNSFRAIILIGDAPAHQDNPDKNPMKFNVPTINKDADEKSVRFLSIKIGDDDQTFKELAVATSASQLGRYKTVPKKDVENFKQNLLKTLKEEWRILSKTTQIVGDAEKGDIKLSSPKADGTRAEFSDPGFLKKYNLDSYEAMIIQARLPDTADSSKGVPDFTKGWIPEKIQGKLAVSEFIFMEKLKLEILINIFDNIAKASLQGSTDGPTAFIDTVRLSLASQLKVNPDQIFSSGETLNDIFEKANTLPFKTTVFAFSAKEIDSWKPPDYERIHKILEDKVKYLREFTQKVSQIHIFGDKPHFYVPRMFFP